MTICFVISLFLLLFIYFQESPHKCATCGKTFNQRSNLKTHLLTHTDVKPYNCDVCTKVFRRNCDLKRHVQAHTETGDVTISDDELQNDRSDATELCDKRSECSPSPTIEVD